MTPKKILYLMLFVVATIHFSTSPIQAQTEVPNQKSNKKVDFQPSLSTSIFHFSDFATSPLNYLGFGGSGAANWKWQTQSRQHFMGIDFFSGMAIANAPLSSYFQPNNSSTVTSFTFSDQHLFPILKPKLPNFLNLSVGGKIISTSFFRSNSSFQNNGTGFESLLNLMLSGKATVDISRKEAWTLDLFLFEKTFKPKERYLSFGFDAGLLNMNLRPSYSYLSMLEFNGSETSPISLLLGDHSWSLNGWRMNTCFEYTRYRKNGNGYKWAYLWDAAYVPGKFENFQIATHSLRYTLIVNLK
ncbi:MAG: hypothetical protein JW735_12985 [Prolixibacteraceae bacterium]|jgi:hypothetical protein|nr:hypothetical protein [Prolixibacteraceae bacterium]